MIDDAPVEDTFLTERQAQVLALREEGLTQRAIADRIGTSVANVSSVESSARDNVERARRTLDIARRLRTVESFTADAGTHLREVVESVYEAGDDAGIKVTYSDPELSAYLHVHLSDRLEGRRLAEPVEVGITPEGDVVTSPAADGQ